MNETTYIRPPSQLRKASQIRRPQVIEHEPVRPAEKDDGVTPWEFDKLGLHIIPGLLNWDKFSVLWDTVDGIRQSSLFFVGDALNAGEAKFGEKVWQIDTTGYRPETLRNAQWVARAFPVSRRRRLPWSYHQVCATSKLSAREQDDFLDMVEEKKRRHEHFTTKDLQALVQERVAAKQPNTPPPTVASDDLDETALSNVDDERDAVLEPDDDEALVPSPTSPQIDGLIEEARSCMQAIRTIATEMAEESFDPIEARNLSNRILALVGRRSSGWASNVLQHSDIAMSLVPDDWRLQIGGSFATNGSRIWEVAAYHHDGSRFVLADGPSLPCCLTETGLAALVSQMSQP